MGFHFPRWQASKVHTPVRASVCVFLDLLSFLLREVKEQLWVFMSPSLCPFLPPEGLALQSGTGANGSKGKCLLQGFALRPVASHSWWTQHCQL